VRILIYGLNFYPELTGVGKYTAELAAWLAFRGHEVRMVCAPPYYPDWALAKGYGNRRVRETWSANGTQIDVWRCPLLIPARPNGITRILHLISFAAASVPTLFGQLRWNPDMIFAIAPTLTCAPAAVAFSKLARCRSWLHIQDFELDAAFGTKLLKQGYLAKLAAALERLLLRGFDRVSTISDKMLERLREKLARAERIMLFPNWVDPDQFRRPVIESLYRREFGCANDDVLVLYSGSIGEKQGLEILLEAAEYLKGKSPFRFVICGEGPTKAGLAKRYSHLPNVAWKPLQPPERLGELLQSADIHALPQKAGLADFVMPSKLIGMMASGKPVIATAAPDTEIANVLDGRGQIVPPGDARALAEAIESLANDPARAAELGKAGRVYVEKHFHRDRVLEKFERELIELVRTPL